MILETGDESSRALFMSAKNAYLERRGLFDYKPHDDKDSVVDIPNEINEKINPEHCGQEIKKGERFWIS